MIVLPKIQPKRPNVRDIEWYNQNDYFQYHCQKSHTIGNCKTLQHKVQDLID